MLRARDRTTGQAISNERTSAQTMDGGRHDASLPVDEAKGADHWLGIERRGEWGNQDRFWRRNLAIVIPVTVATGLAGIAGGIYYRSFQLLILSSFIPILGYLFWIVIKPQIGMWKRGVASDHHSVIAGTEEALREENRPFTRCSSQPDCRLTWGVREVFNLEKHGVRIRVSSIVQGESVVSVGPVSDYNRRKMWTLWTQSIGASKHVEGSAQELLRDLARMDPLIMVD